VMNSSTRGATAVSQNGLAVLGKELRIRVLNCSPSGCLLETRARLEVGTVASLRMTLQGEEFVDDVQVVRCQPIEGAGSIFHIGAQFLWTGTPSPRSLRQVMRRAMARVPAPVPSRPLA
jgi:PilZ domain